MKDKLHHSFKRIYLIWALMFFTAQASFSQDPNMDFKDKHYLKNTVKLNLTANILYKQAFIVGYERLLSRHRSININLGYQEFPSGLELNIEDVTVGKTKDRTGYNFGIDYRFYLKNENKYGAPRGIYLAPFMNYYWFKNNRELTYTGTGDPQNVGLDTKIGFYNIGGELGYQFVLGKRVTIDAVLFGPALTFYSFKAKLDGQLTGLDEDELLFQVIEALKDKFPLLKELSEGGEVKKSGVETFWSAGFRYSISIGFRF